MFHNSAIKLPVDAIDLMKKSEYFQDENESRFKKFRDLDRQIDHASSQLDSMTTELASRKNVILDNDDDNSAMNLFWPSFHNPFETHRSGTYDSTKEARISVEKSQGKKKLMSSILSPTIDLTELYKPKTETSQVNDDGYWIESEKPSSPITSARLRVSSQKYKLEQEFPAPAKNVKDFLSKHASKSMPCDDNSVPGTSKKDDPLLDEKKSAAKWEQAMEMSNQNVERKLKKKKMSYNGKKFALLRKRSVTSKMTDISENAKRKRKRLKSVNSLCTVATRDISFEDKDKAVQKNKKIKSDKYIYPDLNYQNRKETLGKSVATKEKSVEVNQISLKNNETMSIVDDKIIEEKNITEKPAEPSIKTATKTVKNSDNVASAKVEKPAAAPLKKIPESESKKVQEDDEPRGVNKTGKEPKEVKKEKEKVKEIIELKCPRIDEANEYDKFGDLDEKNFEAAYQDLMAPRRYENPTTASKLKQADMTYYRRYHFKSIPFIAGTSLSPSHNIGLCVQEMLGLMKNRQVLINDSTRMLIRKVSKGVEPITSLWPEMQHGKTYVESHFKVQNNDNGINQLQNPVWTSFTPNDEVAKADSCQKSKTREENVKPQKKPNLASEISQDLLQNHPDADNFKMQKKNLIEVKHVFSVLYDQFNRLNNKYENLVNQSERSDSPSLKQEIAKLEKELVVKEEEINVFIYLYQELMELKQQVKEMNYRNSMVCISTTEAYPKMSSRLNPMQRFHNRSQSSIGSSSVQLATKLKTFLSSHKRFS